MLKDIREQVLSCGRGIAANATDKSEQQLVEALTMGNTPFDVVAIDVWHPGWASTICLQDIDAETMAELRFSHFLVLYNKPK